MTDRRTRRTVGGGGTGSAGGSSNPFKRSKPLAGPVRRVPSRGPSLSLDDDNLEADGGDDGNIAATFLGTQKPNAPAVVPQTHARNVFAVRATPSASSAVSTAQHANQPSAAHQSQPYTHTPLMATDTSAVSGAVSDTVGGVHNDESDDDDDDDYGDDDDDFVDEDHRLHHRRVLRRHRLRKNGADAEDSQCGKLDRGGGGGGLNEFDDDDFWNTQHALNDSRYTFIDEGDSDIMTPPGTQPLTANSQEHGLTLERSHTQPDRVEHEQKGFTSVDLATARRAKRSSTQQQQQHKQQQQQQQQQQQGNPCQRKSPPSAHTSVPQAVISAAQSGPLPSHPSSSAAPSPPSSSTASGPYTHIRHHLKPQRRKKQGREQPGQRQGVGSHGVADNRGPVPSTSPTSTATAMPTSTASATPMTATSAVSSLPASQHPPSIFDEVLGAGLKQPQARASARQRSDAAKPKEPARIVSSSTPPVDLSIKTKLSVSTMHSLRHACFPSQSQRVHALHRAVSPPRVAPASADATSSKPRGGDAVDIDDPALLVASALHFFSFPDIRINEGLIDPVFPKGVDQLSETGEMWEDAATSLWDSVTAGLCDYFYLLAPDFEFLLWQQPLRAVVTRTSRGFRRLLDNNGVKFRSAHDGSAEMQQAEEVESELEALQDVFKIRRRSSRALPSTASEIIVSGVDSISKLRPIITQLQFMNEATRRTREPPVLLSNTPFLNAHIKQVKCQYLGKVSREIDRVTIEEDVMEIEGPILPTMMHGLLAALSSTLQQFHVRATALQYAHLFNTGVEWDEKTAPYMCTRTSGMTIKPAFATAIYAKRAKAYRMHFTELHGFTATARAAATSQQAASQHTTLKTPASST
ncbi:hypothetical protein PTSG_04665 [Salpingoeca rosetta]|uniref:Uncharacterized protein n=1 Tax=Salpingoeca rosetta (strain ATCC 50818 / BSB-021) TaxID=946362 RepID=F2U829_SALR5|nr:uncharacterized protein PTSG_04665 [Salpingoeca rosetta]EGD72934.1 hypothetical protein PTSG_04665 [Salpingoeca rosetta]|eukprot:XP_004994756.1 hypothetical protein PTSG_04665 [Salpingoeca rosetta]